MSVPETIVDDIPVIVEMRTSRPLEANYLAEDPMSP